MNLKISTILILLSLSIILSQANLIKPNINRSTFLFKSAIEWYLFNPDLMNIKSEQELRFLFFNQVKLKKLTQNELKSLNEAYELILNNWKINNAASINNSSSKDSKKENKKMGRFSRPFKWG